MEHMNEFINKSSFFNIIDMKRKENKEILICGCHSTDHQLIILYDEDTSDEPSYPTCYFHIHLKKRPLLERIKYGFKYIFGYQCNYGAFDEFIFNPNDANKLQDLVNYLKELKND
jgi:hypothetical protein